MADARISRNIAEIRRAISDSFKAGENSREVTVVVAVKGRAAQEIKDVATCGITDIGENKISLIP